MTYRPKSTSRRSPGFTLVEMMLALAAGTIVISSVYVIGAGSARYFQHQHRLAQSQMGVRTGLDQLRRDIARAGFMGTANTRRESSCVPLTRQLQAIEFLDNVDNSALPNGSENGVSADRLRLVGNYVTSDSYLISTISANGTQLQLQQDWQAFRRSFINRTSNVYDTAMFTDVFRAGRYLHIRTLRGNHFFVQITATIPATRTISINPGLPIGSLCVEGLADGAMVAPLARIEYLITNLGGDLAPSQAQLVMGQPTQLVRREIAFDAPGTPIPNSERVILEFAIDFNLRFLATNGLTPPQLVLLNGAAASGAVGDVNTLMGATPERIRDVMISVSTRTPEQDKSFPFIRRTATEALQRYRVDPSRPGAARVRTLNAEVFVANIAYWRPAS